MWLNKVLEIKTGKNLGIVRQFKRLFLINTDVKKSQATIFMFLFFFLFFFFKYF